MAYNIKTPKPKEKDTYSLDDNPVKETPFSLKDWNEDGNNVWYNDKLGLRLEIYEDRGTWEVEVEHYNQLISEPQNRYKYTSFKTKQEAMRYAQEYMRKK